MRAALYVRVSTAVQEDQGASLQTQEDACRAFAEQRGYVVADLYREVHTGVELWERPQLTALRDEIRHGRYDVVVCHALDRLSRDPVHQGVVISEAEHHKVDVVFVTEPLDNSPEGALVRYIKGYAAKVEHEKIRERSIRGRRNRVASGKPLAGPRPLYGYRWRDAEKSGLEPDSITAPVVERIFVEAASGRTLRSIATGLTQVGIPTPMGKVMWRIEVVRRILHHPSYCGRAFGWAWRPINTVANREFDAAGAIELPEGTIPALVDVATWERVQVTLTRNKERATRNNSYAEAALVRGGVAKCGHCGATMHVQNNIKTGLVYVCDSQYKRASGCTVHNIKVDKLDKAVWARVVSILTDPDQIAEQLERQRTSDMTEADLTAIDREIGKVERRQRNLLRELSLIDNDDLAAMTRAELNATAERRRELEAERERVKARRSAWAQAQANLGGIAAWCHSVAERLDDLAYEQKRLALDALGVRVKVYNSKHTPRYEIEALIPLDVMPSHSETPMPQLASSFVSQSC